MARLHAHDGAPDINELERQAEEQLQNVSRHVANLRNRVHEELDMRGRVKDGVHTKPGSFYGAAAGAGILAGYVVARWMKT
jgi:ElaB/YqjD/DUF883 family membrane-anchored ribosome-binding protein